MTWVGFEPTIPASERAKTVHALDRWATVTSYLYTLILLVLSIASCVKLNLKHPVFIRYNSLKHFELRIYQNRIDTM
jgi:hypothetical protein